MLVASRRCVLALFLLAGCAIPAAAVPGEILASFRAPGTAPRDLAFDGTFLWLLDDEARTLYQLDPATGTVRGTHALSAAHPQGITWAAGRLWIADEATGSIMRVAQNFRTVETTVAAPGAHLRLGGLADDGATLWSGTIAGWSSRVNQVDPQTGAVLRSYFTKGFPEAVEITGQRLWSATHNGGHRTGLIYEYDQATGLHVAQFDAPGDYPVGLAFDGEALWCVDRENLTVYRLALN